MVLTMSSDELLGQRIDVPGRRCEVQRSSDLPPLDAVFDSAAGLAALAALPPSWNGQSVISLSFSPTGTAGRARVLGTELPDSAAGVVLKTVAAAVRDLADPGLPGARLLVSVGGPPSVLLEPAFYCPPEPGPGGSGVARVDVITTGPPPATIRSPHLRILVREDGVVETVDLEVGSGLAELDRAVVDRARQQRYKPALVDGIPVAVWLRPSRP
jgi:TonB family protein